jgi:spermidine synthase
MVPAPSWLVPFLIPLLLLSGVCGLVYQVLWMRLLALTFGVTVHAAATVLASFMGGLAMGSLLAGRLADRSASPLRLFGLVELSIGLSGLASPLVLSALQRGFIAVSPHLPDSMLLGSLIRFVLSFAVLLVPTALMGATMPIVLRSSLTKMEGLGSRVGLLYAANTGGAIAGTLLAGFYLIPRLGLSRSFLCAAAINGMVGLLAIIASRWLPRTHSPGDQEDAAVTTVAPAFSRATRIVLGVAAISGFASLALEVVWFRVLTIFLGPTSYTFTVMLAAVLAGIALGSALAAPLLHWRRLDWVQALAVLQFGGAALILASFTGLLVPGDAPSWLQRTLAYAGIGFAGPALAMSLTVILPTAVFLGASFPIGVRLWAGADERNRDTGSRIGLFYAVNVGAGILGSLLAGFVLLPILGSRNSLILLAALYGAAGIALQAVCARRRPMMTGLMTTALVALVLLARQVPDPLEITRRRIYVGRPVVWQDEGTQTTVAVVGPVNNRVLFLDGRHQSNDSPGMLFIHRRIGVLPVVLHPSPRRALVVGLGGGATPGAMSQFPGLSVDVVELSRGVVSAASYFSHVNFDLLANPRVHVRMDDGRSFLQRVRTPYDVITADAIIPRHAGANSLNSVEYFRLVRDALAPDGVVLHWNGGATEAEFQLILSAFAAAFPYTTLWGDGTLMVGTRAPLTLSRRRIDALLEVPQTREVLRLMHVETFDHLERMFRAGTTDVHTYLKDRAPLGDDRPLLEYYESLPQPERDLAKIGRRPEEIVRP